MDKIEQINFYTVSRKLTVTQYNNFSDCIQDINFYYCIKETRGNCYNSVNKVPFYYPALKIELLDRDGNSFGLEINRWKVLSIQIAPSYGRWGFAKALPTMDISDPFGKTINVHPNIEYYKGILELHKRLLYISKFSNWETANEYKYKMEFKKVFIRLKNGHIINYSKDINTDEYYYIDLSFKNGIFKLNSCIVEGNPYADGIYKNEEQYESEDFHHFIDVIHKMFPTVDFKNF